MTEKSNKKAYPLIMSGPEVRATQEGRKSQIRLIPTMPNSLLDGGPVVRKRWTGLDWSKAFIDPGPSPAGNPGPYFKVPHPPDGTIHRVYCRYQPGDRLWIKEAWAHHKKCQGNHCPKGGCFKYRTDFEHIWGDKTRWLHHWYDKKNALSMSRWASRLTLEVLSTGAEFVGDIREEDCYAEGVAGVAPEDTYDSVKEEFAATWDTLHPQRHFAENPPVWPIAFKVVE